MDQNSQIIPYQIKSMSGICNNLLVDLRKRSHLNKKVVSVYVSLFKIFVMCKKILFHVSLLVTLFRSSWTSCVYFDECESKILLYREVQLLFFFDIVIDVSDFWFKYFSLVIFQRKLFSNPRSKRFYKIKEVKYVI